jgi:large repetitive protein
MPFRAVLSRAALAGCLSCALSCGGPRGNSGQQAQEHTPAEAAESLNAQQSALAKWSDVVSLPLIPVAASNLPDGRLLFWAAEDPFSFSSDQGKTYSAFFDPVTSSVTQRLVTQTGHDMFCPGTANLADGRVLVNGGLSSGRTSIYDPAQDTWTRAADMNIPRAYEGTAPLADGSVLTLGGSWAGGVGNKHGEIWTEAQGWRRLTGVLIDPFLSVDTTRNFGMDSHLWLLQAGNGRVFHGGPGFNMNWVDTSGNGQVIPIGRRGDDEFSINGTLTMYDTGKLLKVGGAPGYSGVDSNANSYVIELGRTVNVRKIQSMAYRRSYHNSVVLPNGQVVIIGGVTVAVNFSDNNAVLTPELFDPVTETFSLLPPMSVPRNYHSIALLLPDGRVLSGGGGLCGTNCAANHPDVQILSPPYLFNADGSSATRPVIQSAPSSAAHGTSLAVTTDSPVASFALIRSASVTHSLNNDQRRLSLSFHSTGENAYAVDVPSNPGWAVPGLYMLFALNAQGVPSVARTLRIGAAQLLKLASVGDQASSVGAQVILPVSASSPANLSLTYAASGLPDGLSIDAGSGVVSGVATTAGQYLAEVSASDGQQTLSTQFAWAVSGAGTTRFVRFQADSEINGNPWASVAELNLLDQNGQVLPRGAWSITADSVELVGENAPAGNAIDGNANTYWHTQWKTANPPPPHWLRIDLGGSFQLGGLRYLPRQTTSPNGTIAKYSVYLSADGVSFGPAIAQGNFTTLGATAAEKTVYFANIARGKNATQSSTNGSAAAALAVDGNSDGVLADGSVSNTNSEANPWWEVDLGATYQLFGARVWNRSDCCTTRLSDYYLLASPAPMAGRSLAQLLADPTVTSLSVPGAAPAVQLSTLPAQARYLRVQLSGSNFLQLAEVEVYGRPVSDLPPTIAAVAAPALVVGAATALTLLGSDPDGDPLTYSVTGLPPGLTVDPTTGVISGSVSAAGSFTVTATVSDGRGGSASTQFNWSVADPEPVIGSISAPIASSGSSVIYTAPVVGPAAVEYQWNFGDGSGDSGFLSSPTTSHTFAAPGAYVVTLTVQNADGSAAATQFLQGVSVPSLPGTAVASSNLAFESRPGTSGRIWVANIDNDTVSVFDTVTRSKLAEIPVDARPRGIAIAPNGLIWVSSKGLSTLGIIDPVSLTLQRTISLPRASEPFGVVVGPDGTAYVALEATGRVLKLDSSGNVLQSLDVGTNPRHLALSAAGDLLLVSRFITRPQPGESTAVVQTTQNGVAQGGEILVVDAASMTSTGTIVLQHSDKLETTVSGRGVPNYLGAPAISPDGLSAWVPSKQDNIARGTLRDGQNLDFQDTVRAISSRIDLSNQVEDYAGRIDHDNSGVASAAVYHPSGVYLFVALEASRQVAVVDAYGKRELFRLEAGRAPQAVVVSPDGRALYVHNALDRSIGVYDLGPLVDSGQMGAALVATLSSVSTEKLSAQVLLGKQLFYDARDTRLARDAYLSCASCHNDGGHDGRVWDFTGLGEGLRNTINLRGRTGAQSPLHWSANFDEGQDFEGQIRTFAQGTGLMSDAAFSVGTRSQPLGDKKAGLSSDLDALAAYLTSLSTFDPSPNRTSAGTLTADAVLGRAVFADSCVNCHGGATFMDSIAFARHDIGTIKPSSGDRLGGPLTAIDTPTLRDVWATAPYLHDGSAGTLDAAVLAHSNLNLSAADRSNVVAFVSQIGSDEAAVPAPPGLTAQYFANSTLAGAAAVTHDEAINFNWGVGSPAGLPADGFSARWTGQVSVVTAGSYRLRTVSDDGVRLWLDGALLIDDWTAHASKTDTSAAVSLQAGKHDIKVEYQELTGNALMQLNWLLPGASKYVVIPAAQLFATGPGLRGQYFNNTTLSGAAALTRYENVSFNWGAAAPATGVPADNYSARWTGQFSAPSTGSYGFQAVSDAGVRVWVNGSLVIDDWTSHASTTDTAPPLTLVAGQRYDLSVEYYELSGGAVMQLNWLLPAATGYVAVPASALYGN